VNRTAEDIEKRVAKGDKRWLTKFFSSSHPADIAIILDRADDPDKAWLFSLLSRGKAADVLAEIGEETARKILKGIEVKKLSGIVAELESDEAADIIGELSLAKREKVLRKVSPEQRVEIKQLLRYGEETAGGIMATEYVAVNEQVTADEAIEEIRAQADEVAEIYNVYVMDKDGSLVGHFPLKKLFLSSGQTKVSQIIEPEVVKITTDMDQEKVANIFSKYDLVAVPVVDERGKLVGRITVDDVLDVMEEEFTEDMYKMAGSDGEELLMSSPFKVARIRLPWLSICLFGEMISAGVIGYFSGTLRQVIALAAFIPVIMAMGGNIGIQSSTITVRGIATGRLDLSHRRKLLFREIQIGALMGVTCGAIVGLLAALRYTEYTLALVVGTAMFSAITVSATIGLFIPLAFRYLKIDPAVAAGPFITTVNDIVGLGIYFFLATLMLGWLT